MRLLYIDFNETGFEDYSLNPKRYGGGRCVAANLLPYMFAHGHYMEIWGHKDSFENIDPSLRKYCHHMEWQLRGPLGKGENLASHVDDGEFDIVLHHNAGMWINCGGLKTIPMCWAVGYGERIHPGNRNLILYNDYQFPLIQEGTRIFKARIGVPIPKFEEYKKSPYIFACHRQVSYFGSHVVAATCQTLGIHYIMAGPLDAGLDIMKYVDNKYVQYVGVLDEEKKIEYQKSAIASPYIHSWPTPFNLSAIQSLAYGSPIIAANVGFWPSLVKHGSNGFFIRSGDEFAKAVEIAASIPQIDCWRTANEYSAEKMVEDYMNVFNEVLCD